MTIILSGLKGDDALGYLAALGLLVLAEMEEISEVRLSWGGSSAPLARVEGEVTSINQLQAELADAFGRLRANKAVIPKLSPNFPIPKAGSKDPMRMTRDEMSRLWQDAHESWVGSKDPWMARWLLALATQFSEKKSERRDVELTPFYAPTGQMAMRTSIFEKTMEGVVQVGGPGDALMVWKRTTYDGANFDERAKRDAAVTTSGDPNNQGAPSATWLASMALYFFSITESGRSASTTAWQRSRMYPGYTSRSFVWPTWEPLLDAAGVRSILALRDLQLFKTNGKLIPEGRSSLAGYGVTGVYGASRKTLSQGDGPLGPTVRLWPSEYQPPI